MQKLAAVFTALLFIVGIAAGVGQHRRATNDLPHNIDRFRTQLAPLKSRGFESLVFIEPPGRPDVLPQARVVMAPCLLVKSGKATLTNDTALSIRAKEQAFDREDFRVLWEAEDDQFYYSLLIPAAR